MLAGVNCNRLTRVEATFDGLDISMRSLVSGARGRVSVRDLSVLTNDFVITVTAFCSDIDQSRRDLDLALRDSYVRSLLSH